MKIREIINNNGNKFTAVVFEENHKILVRKDNTFNHYDFSDSEHFEFNSIEEYENWKANQDWIDKKKVKRVSAFRKVV